MSSSSGLPEPVASDLASHQLASLQADGTYVSLSRLRLRLEPWHDGTSLYCVASNSDLEPGGLEETHCVDEFKLNVQERLSILFLLAFKTFLNEFVKVKKNPLSQLSVFMSQKLKKYHENENFFHENSIRHSLKCKLPGH